MRRPARMADADGSGQGLAGKFFGEPVQLAFGAAAFDMAVGQRGDAGAVIAAIFEAPQTVDKQRSRRALAQNSDNSAHDIIFPFG